MNLRCKPGDLAVIVRSAKGNSVGMLVRCIRLTSIPGLMMPDGSLDRGAVWETDFKNRNVNGLDHPYWMDKDLRPIRDDEGEDQVLRYAGKPEGVTA